MLWEKRCPSVHRQGVEALLRCWVLTLIFDWKQCMYARIETDCVHHVGFITHFAARSLRTGFLRKIQGSVRSRRRAIGTVNNMVHVVSDRNLGGSRARIVPCLSNQDDPTTPWRGAIAHSLTSNSRHSQESRKNLTSARGRRWISMQLRYCI